MQDEDLGLFIAGQWRHAGGRERLARLNPANDQPLGGLWCVTPEDVDDALQAARSAFPAWRARPAVDRATFLHKVAAGIRAKAEDFARTISTELGNVLPATRMEAMVAADVFDWSAGEARRVYGRVIPSRFPDTRQLALKEPIGPVYAACPWNMPLIFPARKIAEALAAGCTVVIKPAEETPATAVLLLRVMEEAGLPPGVVNLVFGQPAMTSRRALASGVIRKVSFTGSVPVGKELARLAADRLVKCTLELGGHAPTIVFDDADVDRTAALLAERKARVSGQVCNSPTRFYVQRGVYTRFRDALARAMQGVRVGDPLDPGTQMGPLVNARRREAIEGFVSDAVEQGAQIAAGGGRLGRAGQFHALTLLDAVPDSARIMREEPFGAVAAMQPFDTLDDVVAKANALPYGLAAYVFSASQRTLQAMTQRLEVGLLGLNGCNLAASETPFGGVKESGYGSEGGSEGVEGFLVTKFVSEEAVG
ncbi:MAG TPA: NAD-dependent succinate-semialdehyde dehydrogenase [Ramlibacter sp.]|nr:NAD-dependent succinate-semialdehyde dehydrogenase [Ramlibacter sp.]